MKISVLQPKIIRGNIDYNTSAIQKLIDASIGDLLVLPEYALTGSLVLDTNANITEWAQKSKIAQSKLIIPEGKHLLLNSIQSIDGNLYNTSTMLPTNETQYKLYPDQPELDAHIKPGNHQTIFHLNGKTFKVIICSDLKHIDQFSTDTLDFLLFIFHFTENNFDKAMSEVKVLSSARKIPVIIASLVSDVNIGFSSYVLGDTSVSLGGVEGVLEVGVG